MDEHEVRATMVNHAVSALGMTVEEAERYAAAALPAARALAKARNVSAEDAIAAIRREAVVAEMAGRYHVSREQAERMALGYEPIPGTMEHAWARFAEALRETASLAGQAIARIEALLPPPGGERRAEGVAEVKIHGCRFSEKATGGVKLTTMRNVRVRVAEADLRRLAALVEAHKAARPGPTA